MRYLIITEEKEVCLADEITVEMKEKADEELIIIVRPNERMVYRQGGWVDLFIYGE